jgi:serine/threonine protein kinase
VPRGAPRLAFPDLRAFGRSAAQRATSLHGTGFRPDTEIGAVWTATLGRRVSKTTVGKYRVEAQIGRGATGVVYKAIDPTLNREVAIKVLRPDAADAETLRRFRTEAAILARLNHSDIATIYELVQTDSELFMVMELVAGESLEAVAARSGRLPVESAAYLIDRVLSALTHAHEVGVVHRDLKPANVMVTRVGGVKLMDFGIACVYAGERITLHGSMMGTPGYMAPEQILGNPVDARADVYAVGAMLYRLLAGAVPFVGDSAVAVIQRQISEPVAPIRSLVPDVPEAYDEIVARAMAKAPDDRFHTADEFRQALGQISGTLKTIDLAKRFAQEIEAPAASPVGALNEGPAAAPVLPTEVLPRRRPRARWTVTAAIVTVAAVAGVLVGRRTRPGEPPAATAPSAPSTGVSLGSAPPAIEGTAPVPQTTEASTPAAPAPQSEPQLQPLLQPQARPRTPPQQIQIEISKAATLAAPAAASVPDATPPAPAAPVAIADKPPELETPAPVPPPQPAQPVKVFDAKLLSVVDAKARELEARLVLEDKMLTVTPAYDMGRPLETVPYEKVKSISYSVSRDPLWMSPHGPEPVVRRADHVRHLGAAPLGGAPHGGQHLRRAAPQRIDGASAGVFARRAHRPPLTAVRRSAPLQGLARGGCGCVPVFAPISAVCAR